MTERDAQILAQDIQSQGDERVQAIAGPVRTGGKGYHVQAVLFPGTPDARRLCAKKIQDWHDIQAMWRYVNR